jgi:hypothetical protein
MEVILLRAIVATRSKAMLGSVCSLTRNQPLWKPAIEFPSPSTMAEVLSRNGYRQRRS